MVLSEQAASEALHYGVMAIPASETAGHSVRHKPLVYTKKSDYIHVHQQNYRTGTYMMRESDRSPAGTVVVQEL